MIFLQVQAFSLWVHLRKAVASVEVIAAERPELRQSMQARRISQEQLDAMSELAVFQKALQDFGTERSHVLDNHVIAKNPLHATLLDNTLDILAFLASERSARMRWRTSFANHWSAI